ncbi:nuclear pore complex protein Nup88 [Aethina tumida]|uniref:nuclear pore complex protein Nup88 n=1 Tax=Aethina tumida TaxID=116153 RepID=UPI00214987C7|nr:nuclear pore complex protein Nup88 [Aethina tumida]
MSSTDYLGLSDQKIFRDVADNFPKTLKKTVNALTIRDGVIFTWDYQNSCALSLNLKAARSRDGDNVQYQKLLPLGPPLFTPEFLVCNESCSLLAVFGPNGVLVLELPNRCPPHGAFQSNKEVVYCKSHSLDERLLACDEGTEVRQVRFHPGSLKDRHVLVLTSDNKLRLYEIDNQQATSIAVYSVGEKPHGNFPGSKISFLQCYGELAVDFDFGLPEIDEEKTRNVECQTDFSTPNQNLQEKDSEDKKLQWPVYILRGNGTVYSMDLSLTKKVKPFLQGPLPIQTDQDNLDEACSILCLNTNPQILCIALSNGTLCHHILLDLDADARDDLLRTAKKITEVPSKELLAFENVELELGLIINKDGLEENNYKCPVFLHKDEGKFNRYFATHDGGVHSVTLECVSKLQEFVSSELEEIDSDVFNKSSQAEYLVCTKTASSDVCNPVVGFALHHEPSSIITLLADGSLVTLGILTAVLPPVEPPTRKNVSAVESPLRTMLREPFDHYIQSILKKASTQPILKLNSGEKSVEECYELLQRAAQVFREDYVKYYTKAREEIEKRVHFLNMIKENQRNNLENLEKEKQILQENAERLAEKYEDIRDKQEELSKRCENLLLLVARRRNVPSDAEKEFINEINELNLKTNKYYTVIDNLRNKKEYQEMQISNWKRQETKKVFSISEIQETTIKNSLKDMTQKINEMKKDINEYKRHLNIK